MSKHYNNIEGIECIDVARHFNFNLGNAIKYIWRCNHKRPDPVADLKKAISYLQYEIEDVESKNEDQWEPDPEYQGEDAVYHDHPMTEIVSKLYKEYCLNWFGEANLRLFYCGTKQVFIDVVGDHIFYLKDCDKKVEIVTEGELVRLHEV